jgi:uncharacterized protein (TIGR00251 family)
MKIQEDPRGATLLISVKPNQRQFKLCVQNGILLVYCREKPVKGRVNRELVNHLSKLFKRKVKILSGLTSTHKKLLVVSADSKEVARTLSIYASS